LLRGFIASWDEQVEPVPIFHGRLLAGSGTSRAATTEAAASKAIDGGIDTAGTASGGEIDDGRGHLGSFEWIKSG
jgi:hypothetical protein